MGVRTTLRLPRTLHSERLAAALIDTQVAFIEGGPGYGKSILAGQVAQAWPHESYWLPIDAPLADTIARLRDYQRPLLVIADGVDRPLRALKIVCLVAGLPRRHRLLITWQGRGPRLRSLEEQRQAPRLGPVDVLFSPAEVELLLWEVLGADGARLTSRVHQSSAGWPEGLSALLADLSRGDARVLAARLDTEAGPAALVAQRAARLEEAQRHRLAQAMALPRMREPLLHALGRDLLRAALGVGLPFARQDSGEWLMPGALARMLPLAALDATSALRCAQICQGHEWTDEAAKLMWLAGQHDQALQIIEDLPAVQAELALSGCGDAQHVASEALARAPRAGLRLLHAAELTGQHNVASQLRQRLATATSANPAVAADQLRAEEARELLRCGHSARARRLAGELVSAYDDGPVRAAALEVLGRIARRRATTDDLLLAQRLLRESLALWRRADEPGRMAELRLALAWVDRDLADSFQASSRAAAVRAEAHTGSGLWMQAALMEADALCDLGSAHEAEALLAPIAEVATQQGAAHIAARVSLLRARAATLRGERAAIVTHLRHVTAADAWQEGVCASRSLAEAAELWSRLGDSANADACLRLLGSVERLPTVDSVVARAAVQARLGDPQSAGRILRHVIDHSAVTPRERWRVRLLIALAAARAGDPAEAHAALRHAMLAATACAQPHAPFLREREAMQLVLRSTQAAP